MTCPIARDPAASLHQCVGYRADADLLDASIDATRTMIASGEEHTIDAEHDRSPGHHVVRVPTVVAGAPVVFGFIRPYLLRCSSLAASIGRAERMATVFGELKKARPGLPRPGPDARSPHPAGQAIAGSGRHSSSFTRRKYRQRQAWVRFSRKRAISAWMSLAATLV